MKVIEVMIFSILVSELSSHFFQWIQRVYCQDVLQRVDKVKASITSVFGNILKNNSSRVYLGSCS